MKYVLIYYLITNLFAFVMYGIDKRKAIKNKHRISEKSLLTISALGGALGSLFAMHMFRHKTKHAKFLIANPLFLCVHVGIIVYFIIG